MMPKEIYETTDYSIFKHFSVNREIEPQNLKQIISNINKNGFKENPLIVNENMYVIDGQHRLEACRTLGLPVQYIVVNGLTEDDCLIYNIAGKKWDNKAYVHYFANKGIEAYQLLDKLYAEFGGFYSPTIIEESFGDRWAIKHGSLSKTITDYENARDFLVWGQPLYPVVKKRSSPTHIYRVLLFCYFCPEINNDRLMKKLIDYPSYLRKVVYKRDAEEMIEGAYNFRSSIKTQVNISGLYEKRKK